MSKPRIADPKAIKAFGLTQIYTPRDDPTIDIVFVHGLNGHPHDSWTSKNNGCFWPTDLLPDVLASLRPRILTYGYNANVTAFTDGASRDSVVSHAETLASTLAANRNLRDCSDRPIIFICHSLGGLIVKRALIYSRSLSSEKTEHLRSVYVSTFGILFLGTPHNGSDIAKWGLLLHNICNAVLPKKFMEASPQLVKALRANNETLQHINSLFVDIMGRFHIYFFHETRSTDVRGTREVIVDEHSAAPYMEGVERAGIEADHSHMCKFDDDNSAGYEVVAEAILRYSRQAPAVISDRWVEEKKARTLEKKAKAREIYDGQSVLSLPRGSATDGRNSPVSDLGNSELLQLSHYPKESPLFVVPPGFHPNATFFGMEKELEVLHNRLFKAKARPEKTMAVLISGVPGSGKTHLARQYVFTQSDCYPGGIFWIDAKSRESTYKCFWEIAQAATLVEPKMTDNPEYHETQKYVSAVRLWLQTRRDWLLVFDGVTFDCDDDINRFREVLPWSKRCSIIYTSVDTTLRKKQRLYEPYCLMISRLRVEDACKLLFKDLGITRATPEQTFKATRIVEYYECLPLAIHAVGHRLNATGKPIEKYHFKSQVTDKKLAEPFLSIMNDLFRLQKNEALHLINLLSFLGHQVPVGLLNLGRAAMTSENLEIQTSAQTGEEPDLDTTLGTLIHYGLVERTTASEHIQQRSSVRYTDGGDVSPEAKHVPDLSESLTESSQEGFFSIYRNQSVVDVIKIHSVVQGFCRDELRIKDEESKGIMSNSDPGYFDTWLIVATRFLITSYEGAMDRMAHYEDCGLVRDYREYETHASRLFELFPKKPAINLHPLVVRETREDLRKLMKIISREIESMSPSSSQHFARNQKSVFDRSSSSSSSFPDSSADEGLSRRSTFNWSDLGSPRAESPEQLAMPPPRFRLELFPPHIFRRAGHEYESEDGYETDGEARAAFKMSPSLSQISQATEKPNKTPPSSSPPQITSLSEWQVVNRHSKPRSYKEKQVQRRNLGLRRFRNTKVDTPLVKVSPVQGKGSSSRTSAPDTGGSLILTSEAEQALAAVRRSSNANSSSEGLQPIANHSANKENTPTYATVATRRMLEVESSLKRPSSVPVMRTLDPASGLQTNGGLQMKPSAESLDSQTGYAFSSPLSHELSSRELIDGPLSRSTYSEPEFDMFGHHHGLNFPTAPGSRAHSRRGSNVQFEAPRSLSASVPTLLPYPPPALPYDEDISIAFPTHRVPSQFAPGPIPPVATRARPIAHPSAIMPSAMPSSSNAKLTVGSAPEHVTSEPMSRDSSAYSHQSWATEPVRYPPRFSPIPAFQQPPELVPTPISTLQQQQQMLAGANVWTTDLLPAGSALQSEPGYPGPPLAQGRLGSMNERLKFSDPGWNPDLEPAQSLHFGAHRVDVRDPRHRLHESALLQAPRPQYRLYHPNLSGSLIQHGGQIYAPAPQLGVYGTRTRSGSSPARPDHAGLGMRY